MRPIAAHVTSSVICVCVRVGHMGELCKNGWTNGDAVCCNSLYHSLPKSQMTRFQQSQNCLAFSRCC